MSISKDKNDLEALIYGKVSPSQPTSSSPKPKQEDDIVDKGEDELDSVPIFTFDYENDMKGFRKRAYKTVWAMARHILPEEILNDDYVKNKIEQDVDTLSELYWTRKSNTDIKLSIMDSISKGNTAPRMYDAYKSINDSISDNNKQIIMTEENLRKTYTDLKYEIQCRRAELDKTESTLKKIGITESKALPSQERKPVTFTGTKALIEMAKQQKRNEYLKENAEDVEVVN